MCLQPEGGEHIYYPPKYLNDHDIYTFSASIQSI